MNKLLKTINTELDTKKDWQKFDNQIQYVHPEFWKKLNDKYPDLTRNEKQLCVHIRNNKTSQEIADLLFVSMSTVETGRYRLRKKLSLSQEINLSDFIKKM